MPQIADYSIIIPTFNRPDLLKRSVASAQAAASPTAEIIVADDASRLPASTVLAELADDRIRVVLAGGKGAGHARNVAIKAARGELLFFLDDDDELIADYCERVLALVNGRETPDFGYSSAFFEEKGQRIAKPRMKEGLMTEDVPFRSLLNGFGMGFWAKRTLVKNIGLINENLVTNEDTDYLLRLIKSGAPGWYSEEPGVVIHANAGDANNAEHLTSRTKFAERAAAFTEISVAHKEIIDRIPGARNYIDKRTIKFLIRADEVRSAWSHVKKRPRIVPYFLANLAAKKLGRTK